MFASEVQIQGIITVLYVIGINDGLYTSDWVIVFLVLSLCLQNTPPFLYHSMHSEIHKISHQHFKTGSICLSYMSTTAQAVMVSSGALCWVNWLSNGCLVFACMAVVAGYQMLSNFPVNGKRLKRNFIWNIWVEGTKCHLYMTTFAWFILVVLVQTCYAISVFVNTKLQ